MTQVVTSRAQPENFKWLGVLFVVRSDSSCDSAPLTQFWSGEESLLNCPCHKAMGSPFFTVSEVVLPSASESLADPATDLPSHNSVAMACVITSLGCRMVGAITRWIGLAEMAHWHGYAASAPFLARNRWIL
jgi:hypothetical protein